MSIGEEVLFRVTLGAESTCPSQNSIPRTRNENFVLKSSSENNDPPTAALRAVGGGRCSPFSKTEVFEEYDPSSKSRLLR
jgi:hypothetical protein